MKVSKKILDEIKTNREWSLQIAEIMGIREISVIQLANRESSKLTLYSLVEFYKSKGYTENEIFEPQKETV